tara:strand:+ start:1520 stop:2053 length:534 start_codon:yes stop_codon:yes gene_type:complete
MSRTLSLRGVIETADNAQVLNHRVFTYEANDLTRGWVVEAAYLWPKTTRAASGGNGHLQAVASLTTDTILDTGGFPEMSDASDNRQIGWCNSGYLIRDSAVTDFLSNGSNPPNPAPFLIDPEHVVAKGLFLQFYTTSDFSTAVSRDWNYMVVLRAKKLDPKETILHLIKNVAQDIVN